MARAEYVKTIYYADGRITYHREANRVSANEVRICLRNRTGQPKWMTWDSITGPGGRKVNDIHAETNGALSCVSIPSDQRVEWTFWDRSRDLDDNAMNLHDFGGQLITFTWVSDFALPVSTSGLTTWIGKAPDCRAFYSDCERHGLEYITWSSTGNGNLCLIPGSYKVQCRMPAAPAKPSVVEDVNTFNVLSYNIFNLPDYFPGNGLKTGQRERSCQVPRAIADYERDLGVRIDAIAISEAFIDGCIGEIDLRTAFRHHGWQYSTMPVTGHASGLFIVSRWQIEVPDELIFENKVEGSWDALAPKGVHYGRIRKNVGDAEQIYHLFITHFQADPGSEISTDGGRVVRLEQAREMRTYIDSKDIPTNQAVILAGDFNVQKDSADYASLLQALQASVPDVTDGMRTNVRGLTGWDSDGVSSWVDYVMTSDTHRQPIGQSLNAQPFFVHPFKICTRNTALHKFNALSPESADCLATLTVRALSDHAAVLGQFEFQ